MTHAQDTFSRNAGKLFTWMLATALLAGCHSKTGPTSQSDILDMQAKAAKLAATTGSPQTFTSINSAGQTVTTTVQPPSNGAPGAITSVVTGPAPNAGGNQPVPTAPAASDNSSYNSGPATGNQSGPGQSGPVSAIPNESTAPATPPAAIDVPAGTALSIRINQHISVKTTRPGDTFTGSLAAPIVQGNSVVVPQGSDVEGVVVSAHKRGRFKGASILQLQLTALTMNGRRYPLDTRDLTRTKKGKGKRSLAFIGGGTGLGMLIGGVASGGTGLLIGGLAGAGAGTGAAAFTGNGDINIPAESIVSFKLADDLVIQP
ncbi:MAG: hypothetical protein ACYCSN_01910 [Acidobacteriaceae bacterium]